MFPVGKIVEPLSSEGTATPSRNPAGEPECGSEWYEVKRDFNRFMYGDFVKLVKIDPLPVGPLEPEVPRHGSSCLCGVCSVAGQVYADYLRARSNEGL